MNWCAKFDAQAFINDRLPIEFFDFIVIDECHRSIYNIWLRYSDYSDAFFGWSNSTP